MNLGGWSSFQFDIPLTKPTMDAVKEKLAKGKTMIDYDSGQYHESLHVFSHSVDRFVVPPLGGNFRLKPVLRTMRFELKARLVLIVALSALPHCTLIGQPTRGASGNPDVAPLPNGVDVWYSRWVSMTPDGGPIEDVGVQPDILVEHGEGDPAFERALETLRKQ